MEIVTSWERKGIEKGRMEGRLEGREEGRQEGKQEGRMEGKLETLHDVLLDLLTFKFGPMDEHVTARVRGLDSEDDLRSLVRRAMAANSLHDLGLLS